MDKKNWQTLLQLLAPESQFSVNKTVYESDITSFLDSYILKRWKVKSSVCMAAAEDESDSFNAVVFFPSPATSILSLLLSLVSFLHLLLFTPTDPKFSTLTPNGHLDLSPLPPGLIPGERLTFALGSRKNSVISLGRANLEQKAAVSRL